MNSIPANANKGKLTSLSIEEKALGPPLKKGHETAKRNSLFSP